MPTLVFDCETIPDITAYAHLLGRSPETPLLELEADWIQADRPFKPLLQQIVSLAAAWIQDDGTLSRLATLGTTEAEAVTQFFDMVSHYHPILVGWNTQGFDLPVLLTRATVHQIPIGDFTRFGAPYDGYLKRYSEKLHRDLMDIQAVFRATMPLKMDEMAVLLGVPGKLDTNGSQVSVLYAAGSFDRIHAYCQHDVLTTAWVYRRMAVSRGWWTADQAERFDTSAADFLAAQAGSHWDVFREALGPA